jgi:ribosomal protein S18 acetylase RimI-like enzyme
MATSLDLSATSLSTRIQANLIAYMRLFAGLPGMRMRDDDELFWFVSRQPAPGDNILRARWPAERAEAAIDTVLAEVGQYVGEIGWMVFPTDQPGDLGQRLEARGMPGGPGGFWLWADLARLEPGPAMPAPFRIEQVHDDAAMAAWVQISEAGFGEALGCFYDAYARHGYGPAAYSLHFIGYLGDVPVTSATLLEAGGTASIYDVSTPPALRRQGFGGAITRALLQHIRERGYNETWIWSSAAGKGVYEALGYVEADFGLREHKWATSS